jgi:hypothetical protein
MNLATTGAAAVALNIAGRLLEALIRKSSFLKRVPPDESVLTRRLASIDGRLNDVADGLTLRIGDIERTLKEMNRTARIDDFCNRVETLEQAVTRLHRQPGSGSD